MKILRHILFIAISSLSMQSMAAHHAEQGETLKAVLVTGSSSGLGFKMTELLSENGFFVYAGVLHTNEMAKMNAMENVEAVQFDVTKQDEIDAAVVFVEKQGRGLYGLINNAGVAIFGPITEVPIEQLEYQMDVNVYGPYRVTQAFAPLIIKSKGRIATTGSIAGTLSSLMFGQYSMSKHAIEAFTDALSAEMAQFDVSVHVIEPGNYASEIGNTAAKRIKETNYWPVDGQFSEARESTLANLAKVNKGTDPLAVAEAALDIMSLDAPKKRYMVVPYAAQADLTIRKLINRAVEQNLNQKYSFDREQLIKIIDEELAKNKQ